MTITTALTCITITVGAVTSKTASSAESWVQHRLTTQGSGYERGWQQGQQFRDLIREDFVTGDGAKVRELAQSSQSLRRFLETLKALPSGQELIDEMQGIAEGAGVPFAHIAALNLCRFWDRRHACSTVLLPTTSDGPFVLNTDDCSAKRVGQRRTYVFHVAYPVKGHALAYASQLGTVWASRGINDAGLALGASSGGVGHTGFNPKGLYGNVAIRYALQFTKTTEQAIRFITGQRQITKPQNISILDPSGHGAILEYTPHAVGVRRGQEGQPLYATNFLQTDVHKPMPESQAKTAYHRNAWARYHRIGDLIASTAGLDLTFAKGMVCDLNDGKVGQLCQENDVMYTRSASVWLCREASVYYYGQHPVQCEPWYIRLDAKRKPSEGKSAPLNKDVVKMTGGLKGSTKYLEAVHEFLDTLIEHGTDRYGPEHSPMFCSILDLKTRRMPEIQPPLLPGQREQDRAFPGGNLAQDMLTLLTMYHLSQLTGQSQYAKAADDYLHFFLKRCAPIGNGLLPCGEHAFWNFREETIERDTHEHLGFIPASFLDKLWYINPEATETYIRALRHHVVDENRWYWTRHAWITQPQKRGIRAFPRHGGFYLYEWVYLYTKRKDPEMLEWAGKTAEVHWEQRHPVTSFISSYLPGDVKRDANPDKVVCSPQSTLSFGLSLLDANALLGAEANPRFAELGQAYITQALQAAHDPKHGIVVRYVNSDRSQFQGFLAGQKRDRTIGFWSSLCPSSGGYGFNGAEQFAIMCLKAYRLTNSRAHLRFAKDVWNYYQTQNPPPAKRIWPGKYAAFIALSLDLYDISGEKKYIDHARGMADESLDRLLVNGLFRADTGSDHYEASSGAGCLAFELLRLHLVHSGEDYELPRNYWDR